LSFKVRTEVDIVVWTVETSSVCYDRENGQ